MTEQCEVDPKMLDFYISQRVDISKKLESAKQNEKKAKEFMEEQDKKIADLFKKCHDLEKENDILKENSLRDTQLQNELLKKLITIEGLKNKTAENCNLLQNIMQILINDQHDADSLKQAVLNDIQKSNTKKEIEESAYVKQLNDTSDYVDQLKYQHSKTVEYYDTLINNNKDEIFKTKQNEIQLQTHITDVNQQVDKLHHDLNDLYEQLNEITQETFQTQTKFNELNKQNEAEDIEYNQKINDVLTIIANFKEEFQKLENEFDECQNGSIFRKEFLDELKIQKITVEETISILETNCIKTEIEIKNLEEQLQKERDDNQINILNNHMEELELNNTTLEKDNLVFEKEFSEITIEENSLNTDINDSLAVSKDFEAELKQQEYLSEEQCLKAENEVAALKNLFVEETEKETIVDEEEKELINKHKEINDDYEMASLQNDAVSAEAEVDEITINHRIDSLKNEINKEKHEIQEKQEEISKIQMIEKMKIEQLQKDYDEEIEKLVLELKETKIELNEHYQKDKKIKSDELKKIKELKNTHELQISEFKVCTQNLQNELQLKIKELDKLYEELTNKDNENPCAELINKTDTSKENPSFNKPNELKKSEEFKIPKSKIPISKYSSSSNGSDVEYLPAKRRKIHSKYRRTPDKKETSQKKLVQDSQKSIDDIFEALKHGTRGQSLRKKSIKKPVY